MMRPSNQDDQRAGKAVYDYVGSKERQLVVGPLDAASPVLLPPPFLTSSP